MRAFTVFTCLLALGLGAGCKVYNPDLVNQTQPDLGPSASDLGPAPMVDLGPPNDMGNVNTMCPPGSPPCRPTGAMDGTSMPDLYFALRDVELDQRMGNPPKWQSLGFNLDGLTTIDETDRVLPCMPRVATESPVSDGLNGIDNSLGFKIYEYVALAVNDLESNARAAQLAGRGTVIVRIRGWNGMPNDPVVDVSISQAVFGTPGATMPNPVIMGSTATINGMTPPPPGWMGSDWYWARRDSFFEGDVARPTIRDDAAFVTNNQFVFTLPDRSTILFLAQDRTVKVKFTNAVAVATISADKMSLMNVVVGGRWAIDDVLADASFIGVCTGTTQYSLLQSVLNRYGDIRSNPGTDRTGAMCDAISLGVRFQGVRANFGGIMDGLNPPNPCIGDAGVPRD